METPHESSGIGKKNMPPLQNRSPQARGIRDLQREKA